jgi:hypothetical protein
MRWKLTALVAIAMALGNPAEAALLLSGQPRLFMNMEVTPPPAPGKPGNLRVMAGGIYSAVQTGRVDIHLPRGFKVVSGALSRTVHTDTDSADNQWDIQFVPQCPGRYEISGRLTVDVEPGYGRDEAEYVATLTMGRDTVWATPSRAVRYERVTGKQRYRYSGIYMVPIAHSERVIQDDIVVGARVLRQVPATCAHCGPGEGVNRVSVTVFLNEKGKLVDVRAIPYELPSGRVFDPDSTTMAAVRRALARWEFSPSRTESGPVADYLGVRVELRAKP